MKKGIYLVVLWLLVLVISGCEAVNIAENSTAPQPNSITFNDKNFSVDEINSGIQAAFHKALYYHKDWQNGRLSDKTLTYELFFDPAAKANGKPQVFMIVTNVEHPLSTEDECLHDI